MDILEQTMFIILVLGHCLMPKGDMSCNLLSQLLMAYVGLGADIFETMKRQVENSFVLIIVGLSLFSWALMEFTLVLAQIKSLCT